MISYSSNRKLIPTYKDTDIEPVDRDFLARKLMAANMSFAPVAGVGLWKGR